AENSSSDLEGVGPLARARARRWWIWACKAQYLGRSPPASGPILGPMRHPFSLDVATVVGHALSTSQRLLVGVGNSLTPPVAVLYHGECLREVVFEGTIIGRCELLSSSIYFFLALFKNPWKDRHRHGHDCVFLDLKADDHGLGCGFFQWVSDSCNSGRTQVGEEEKGKHSVHAF
ncbi:hypothetical protein Taro_052719, partial [Colocasia esculenta]|nr:hypothetical protein [Colocasia esculenta]